MSYVIVQKPIGMTQFSHSATADVFEKDVLTVSCTDTACNERSLAVFQPDAWLEATVYDDRGYPLHSHINSQSARNIIHAEERIKELAVSK